MSGFEYFKRCITERYADFSGRSRRAEFWYFVLFATLITMSLYIPVLFSTINSANTGEAPGGIAILFMILYTIVALAFLIPNLAAIVRRLHDTGRSGWWYLIVIVPLIGAIVLLIFLVQDSQAGSNRWGPNPKAVGSDVLDQLNKEF